MPEVRVVVSNELDRYMNTVVQKGMFGSKAELIRAALIRYIETLPIRVPSGYDDTNLFSPDGRIFQIEYAMESPPRGVTILGLRYKGGIILAKERPQASQTEKHHTILTQPWETFQITDHIGMVPTGLSGDFLLLKHRAIHEAQTYQRETETPIPVEELTNRLALFIHSYTTKKDIRPLGLLALIGGIDDTGLHLYVLDPSGTYREVLTWCEGTHRNETNTILNEEYAPNHAFNKALALTIKSLLRDKTRTPDELNAAVIETKTNTIRKITTDEIKTTWTKAFS
ncbi:MAG: hypothetical protein ACFFBR_01300 [Promethearchaeota archaeon]